MSKQKHEHRGSLFAGVESDFVQNYERVIAEVHESVSVYKAAPFSFYTRPPLGP